MIIRCKPNPSRHPPLTVSSIPQQLKRVESSLRAAKRNLVILSQRNAKLEKIRQYADELCTAVDCKADDIGGQRSVLEILQDLGRALGDCED